jgi:2-keto-3-deoxy-L-rhamnonate aldolase RhmA
MPENKLKTKFAAGEPALGCSMMFPSPQIVEMLGHAGFDWVLLDCEHGSLAPADVEVMAMAALASGVVPIARPKTNAPSDIQTVMDRGVLGVQIPHVNTADDARRAVASVKLGAKSLRSLAAGTRADRWGFAGGAAEFAARANAESLVCIQLEHAHALENVDEILKVEDVDVFFIGPSDLSQSMGQPGNPSAAPVAAAIEAALEKIVRSGKTPGMPAGTDNVGNVIASGVRYVYTHLPRLIGAGATSFMRAAKA